MANKRIYDDLVFLTQRMIGGGTTNDDLLTAAGKHMFGEDYFGTFASDELPEQDFKYAIINVDTRKNGGSHWVALARIEHGSYMVYDSFGRKTARILPKLHMHTVDTEHDAEQSIKEKNCGARALAWLLFFDELGPDAAKTI